MPWTKTDEIFFLVWRWIRKEIAFVLPTSSSQVCHCFEITIEFQSFIQTYPVLLPPPFLSPDGSITGAMLRELLKLSLSVCVSSSVQAEPSNLLTTQEKRERTRRKSTLFAPQMTPAGSHRLLDSAGRLSQPPPPFYFARPPDSDFQTQPYWAFLHGGAQAAAFSRKKSHDNQMWNK